MESTVHDLLHSRGSFRVVVSVNRWLLVRGSCHVPLSVVFGPPVTSRASLVHISRLLVVASLAIMQRMVSIVWIGLIPAPVLCIHITPLMVSSPLWHRPVPAKEDY